MIEWLKRPGYDAEREFEAGLCHAKTGKLSVNPAVNEYLFRIREG